jgi:hypothetical protein
MRWRGHCYRCGEDRDVESRPDHAMQVLCDECAALPHELPASTPGMEAQGAGYRQPKGKGPVRVVTSSPMYGARYQPIHWLWRMYLALGKITLLAGLPGQGKSQLTCLLAGMTSRGMLDQPAGDVLMVSGEDDKHDTIYPRLGAAGGDPARLHVLDVRERYPDGTIAPTTLAMPDDARGLREELQRFRAPRLLVLDPVTAFLAGAVDAHKNAEVRRALAPLKALAEDFSIAILLVTHLNKAKEVEPLMRIADSGAFTALARGVLLMAADPEDEEGDRGQHKVMALAKSNIAMSGEHSLRFRINSTQATDDFGTTVEVGALDITGRSALSAHDLLTPQQERPALDEARIFLRAELGDQWRESAQIKKLAKDYGLAESTLRRAREIECQRPRKIGKGGWWWALRGVSWAGNGEEGAHARAGAGSTDILDTLPDQDAQEARVPGIRAREDTLLLRWRDAMLGERSLWEDEE